MTTFTHFKGVSNSCLHMAFVFQEAVQHLRDQKKKAYVALLDVQKAFDTVWHNGFFHKLSWFLWYQRLRLADPEEVISIHHLSLIPRPLPTN